MIPTLEFTVDRLAVSVHADRPSMGRAAADHMATTLSDILTNQARARIVVGSAPSQDEFFDYLTSPKYASLVDWSRITVFHMDEYVGLAADHPQNFRTYQREHLLSKLEVGSFHEIRGEADDPDSECRRLTDLLTEAPIDMLCLGIGENGHLAFNDPPADFDDPAWVKVVELDDVCRRQQVNDGCFPTFGDVPTHAITLTLSVFQHAGKLSGVVPGPTKAAAVKATLEGPISEDCPATLMRRHPDARLYLDVDAASKLG